MTKRLPMPFMPTEGSKKGSARNFEESGLRLPWRTRFLQIEDAAQVAEIEMQILRGSAFAASPLRRDSLRL
jgi:hypothetical protein